MNKIANYFTLGVMPLLLLLSVTKVNANELTVAAANSTCSVLKKVGTLYKAEYGTTIKYICKSSGRLAKGLKGESIKADVYISANKSWMDKMVMANQVYREEVRSLWGNSLVIAVNKDSPLKINEWNELSSDEVKTILIGDPGTAPFGRYAKQALKTTGLWGSVKNKIKTKKHITLLAETVAKSDHNTVGILFGTNINEGMKVIYSVDTSWHDPIRYYSAPVRGALNPVDAKSFIEFIGYAESQKIFMDAGFKGLFTLSD